MKKYLFLIALWFVFIIPIPANAACAGGTCFWILGTGTIDGTLDLGHWSVTTGGASCACVPNNTTDNMTFDAASGGGTVTVNANITVGTLTMGAFTGTLDFATNNNSPTFSQVSISGTGTRTLNMGNGTWTLTRASSPIWTATTTTNLTFNKNSSTIVVGGTPTSNSFKIFAGGGLTYNNLTLNSAASNGLQITGSNTFNAVTFNAPGIAVFQNGVTNTITTLSVSGSSSSNLFWLATDQIPNGGITTISSANNFTCNWCGLQFLTVSGAGTFTGTNSFNLGGNTGWSSITAPSGGGGGGRIIGG